MSPAHGRFQMIRVLGPIDVLTSTGPIPVGGHAAVVLGALSVAANHVVPGDQLAWVVWGDTPPRSWRNTLQSCVSRLRGPLGAERIIREGSGYELRCGLEEIDALRFEHLARTAHRLVADGRLPDARSACTQGLELWRGRPFGDLADRDPFRLEALRLDELRVGTMELRIRCDLALGDHQLVVGQLEALVEEYPYRERLWELLIEALSRSGRRVEAMAAREELRRVLAGVGLEPDETEHPLLPDSAAG